MAATSSGGDQPLAVNQQGDWMREFLKSPDYADFLDIMYKEPERVGGFKFDMDFTFRFMKSSYLEKRVDFMRKQSAVGDKLYETGGCRPSAGRREGARPSWWSPEEVRADEVKGLAMKHPFEFRMPGICNPRLQKWLFVDGDYDAATRADGVRYHLVQTQLEPQDAPDAWGDCSLDAEANGAPLLAGAKSTLIFQHRPNQLVPFEPARSASGGYWLRLATGISLPGWLDFFRKDYTIDDLYYAWTMFPVIHQMKFEARGARGRRSAPAIGGHQGGRGDSAPASGGHWSSGGHRSSAPAIGGSTPASGGSSGGGGARPWREPERSGPYRRR